MPSRRLKSSSTPLITLFSTTYSSCTKKTITTVKVELISKKINGYGEGFTTTMVPDLVLRLENELPEYKTT